MERELTSPVVLDQRILKLSSQVKDLRSGLKIVPEKLIKILPEKWKQTVGVKLNPPSVFESSKELSSLMELGVWENSIFMGEFWWRVSVQQHLDVVKRSKNPFFNHPDERDDQKLVQEDKQHEGRWGKYVEGVATEIVRSAYPNQDCSPVLEWLESSRIAGMNLGTVFYCSSEILLLKQHMENEKNRIISSRERVPADVRQLLNVQFKSNVPDLF